MKQQPELLPADQTCELAAPFDNVRATVALRRDFSCYCKDWVYARGVCGRWYAAER